MVNAPYCLDGGPLGDFGGSSPSPGAFMGASWLRLGSEVIACKTVWVFTVKRSKTIIDNDNVIPFPNCFNDDCENFAMAA